MAIAAAAIARLPSCRGSHRCCAVFCSPWFWPWRPPSAVAVVLPCRPRRILPSRTAGTGNAAANAGLPPGNPVVARVNGAERPPFRCRSGADKRLPPQMQKLPLAQLYPMLLERLIDGMLVDRGRRARKHLDESPEVKRRLKLLRGSAHSAGLSRGSPKGGTERRSAQGGIPEVDPAKAGAARRSMPATSWSRPRPRQSRSSTS